ncbi:MAG TPA: integrase arm-type DNA-binding domain-containing protein, partial [Steroidobacteraceae bacterium]|nr:integrase arm-type DNA-binding domain-containing protein [Steroidobacteraceae bacterium]
MLDRPYKLSDGRGLYLLVNPNGSRLWRFRYRLAGVEKLLSLGNYPDTSLQKARMKRDAARTLLADGGDPSAKRKAEKHAQSATFAAVAEEWLETKRATLTDSTWQRDKDQLFKIVGPHLGKKPIAAIEAPDLLAV